MVPKESRVKPKKDKMHLLDVAEPLLSFSNLIMRCGLTLKNAKPKFMRAEDLRTEVALPFGICAHCLHNAPVKSDEREYLYGLIEGQSARDLESEEAA